jgi:hypothetical protein
MKVKNDNRSKTFSSFFILNSQFSSVLPPSVAR